MLAANAVRRRAAFIMAKLLNPKEPLRFEPSDQAAKPESSRVVYLLKVPTHWDRIAFRKALAAKGARRHGRVGILRGLRKAVDQIAGIVEASGESRDRLIADIDVVIDAHVTLFADIAAGKFADDDEEAAKSLVMQWRALADAYESLDALSRIAAETVPAFAALLADDDAFNAIFALVAAKKFLIGWENVAAAFARDASGVTDDALESLPGAHISEIGAKVEWMLNVTETEAKNSVSPSPSSSIQATSTAASTTDQTIL